MSEHQPSDTVDDAEVVPRAAFHLLGVDEAWSTLRYIPDISLYKC